MTYEVVLTQKQKRLLVADSAAEAVQQAMKEVADEAQPFTPATWTVKEKEVE